MTRRASFTIHDLSTFTPLFGRVLIDVVGGVIGRVVSMKLVCVRPRTYVLRIPVHTYMRSAIVKLRTCITLCTERAWYS